jgi:hypothetical protein
VPKGVQCLVLFKQIRLPLKTTQNENLKLIQIGLTYVIPRLKYTEEIKEEPRNFQIEIIDRLTDYSDKELDKAIKN